MRLHKDGESFDDANRAQERSARREVRNPIYGLKAMAKIQALPPEAREALAEILAELRVEAAEKAEHSWQKKKGLIAAYWKAVSVYCGHIRRAVLKPLEFFHAQEVAN